MSSATAFMAVQFNLVLRYSHRHRVMNFEPGNQEAEERVVSLILFASDSACRYKSEERRRVLARAHPRHRANWLSVSAERNFKAQSFGRIQPRNSTRIIQRLVGPFLHTLVLRDIEREE